MSKFEINPRLNENDLKEWETRLKEREFAVKQREDACLRLELEVEKWKALSQAYRESLQMVAPALNKHG